MTEVKGRQVLQPVDSLKRLSSFHNNGRYCTIGFPACRILWNRQAGKPIVLAMTEVTGSIGLWSVHKRDVYAPGVPTGLDSPGRFVVPDKRNVYRT